MLVIRKLLMVAGSVLAVFALTVGTVAAATYSDAFSGAEIAATATQGSFVGTTSLPLSGSWEAVVDHTPLKPNATITGGTFKEAASLNGQPVGIVGTFNPGGRITLVSATTGCTNQQYAISDALKVSVTTGGSTVPGTAALQGVLTHYRTLLFGSCLTYSATVVGTVSFTF